jgi:hypothetical protein
MLLTLFGVTPAVLGHDHLECWCLQMGSERSRSNTFVVIRVRAIQLTAFVPRDGLGLRMQVNGQIFSQVLRVLALASTPKNGHHLNATNAQL